MKEAHLSSDDSAIATQRDFVLHAKDIPDTGHHDQQQNGGAHFVVDDAQLLFSGHYSKAGNDLVISADGRDFVVHDYFRGEARAPIYAPDGSSLSGDVVSALAGHTSFAQAGDPAPAADTSIGHVAKLTGTAHVIRNGVTVELNVGDKVFKSDVVEAGKDAALGIVFVDGTAFSLGSNARMVLNDMVYDPNGSSNSSFLSLVQGSITFVAGQTAKNGSMKIDTPVATMGIRGTAVFVDISADNGPTKFSVLVEPGNHVGLFELFDKYTGDKIGEVGTAGINVVVQFSGFRELSISQQPKTPADLAAEQALIQQVFSMAFSKLNDANPKLNFGSIGSGVSPDGTEFFYPFVLQAPSLLKLTSLTGPSGEGSGSSGPSISYDPPPIVKVTNASTTQTGGAGVTNVVINETAAPGSFLIGNQVKIIDPSVGTPPFFDIAVPYVPNTGFFVSAVDPAFQAQPGYALPFTLASLVSINKLTGEISYNHNFEFLGQGESVTYTFQFDAYGGPSGFDQANHPPYTVVATITLTIVGVNDPPVIENPTSQNPQISLAQDPGVQLPASQLPGGSAQQANGDWVVDANTYTFTDPDFNDTHKIGATFDAAHSSLGAFSVKYANTPFGTFSVDATQTDSSGSGFGGSIVINATPLHESINGATGSFAWTLTLNPDQIAYLDSLPAGTQLTETFDVTVTDNNGAVATQVVTIDLPMTDTWTGAGGDGQWSTAGNWSAGVPGPISVVDIAPGTATTVTLSADDTIFGLDTNSHTTLDISSGKTLTIAGQATSTLSGSIVNNGTILVSSQLLQDAGATISYGKFTFGGTTYFVGTTATIDLTSPTTTAIGTAGFQAGDTITVDGHVLDVVASAAAGPNQINVTDSVTELLAKIDGLSGGSNSRVVDGQLLLNSGPTENLTITSSDGAALAALGLGGGVTTSAGTFEVTASATIDDVAFTNNGTIKVDGSQTLTLEGGTTVTGGTLNNAGTVKVETLGATLDGVTVNNTATGSVIQIDANVGPAPSISTLVLTDGTTISGGKVSIGDVGVLDVEKGAVAISGADATLDNVSVVGTDEVLTTTGTIVTPASLIEIGAKGAATLLVDDNTSIANGAMTIGSGSTLDVETGTSGSGATLDGIAVTGSGTIDVGAATSATLILDGGTSIDGVALSVGGEVEVKSGAGASLTNLTVENGGGASTALIVVDSGSKLTLSDVTLSAVTLSGGTVDLNGSGNGSTVTATSTIKNGTLEDGTLTTTSGSTLMLESETLSGVTLDGLVVDLGGASSTVTSTSAIKNGTLEDGTLTVSGVTLTLDNVIASGVTFTDTASGATLNIDAGAALTLENSALVTGGDLVNLGTVYLESSTGATLDGVNVTGGGALVIDLSSTPGTVLLDDGTTITGGSFTIDSLGKVEIGYGTSGVGATLNDVAVGNSGQIQVGSGATATFNVATFTNSGTITLQDSITSPAEQQTALYLNVASGALQNAGGTINDTGLASELFIQGNATFDGGTLNIGGGDVNHASLLWNYDPAGSGAILMLDAALTINVVGNAGLYSTTTNTAAGTQDWIDNYATIDTSVSLASGSILYIQPDYFLNYGAINAGTGLTVEVEAASGTYNAGTITATTGGAVDFQVSKLHNQVRTVVTGTVVDNDNTNGAAAITAATRLVGTAGPGSNDLGTAILDGSVLTVDGKTITFSTAQTNVTTDASGNVTIGIGTGSTLTVQDVLNAIDGITGSVVPSTVSEGELILSYGGTTLSIGGGTGNALAALGLSAATTTTHTGVINADGGIVTLETGNVVVNFGLLEATNGGTIDVKDATIDNSGLVTPGSTLGILIDSTSTLLIDAATVQLTGGGDVSLQGGLIVAPAASGGTAGDPLLENVDNTISGAGTIGRNGDSALTLQNDVHGTIDATGVMVLDTGNTITNAGTLEATSGGKLVVDDNLTGTGSLLMEGGGTIELATGTAQSATFAGTGGTLQIDKLITGSGSVGITATATGAATLTITGTGGVTSTGADAVDVTSAGGDVTISLSGAITGADAGVSATENGAGEINLITDGTVTGNDGVGLSAVESTSATGDIIVQGTGNVTGTGSGNSGILAEILNALDGGNIQVLQTGSITGAFDGIEAVTHGSGNVTVTAGANATITGNGYDAIGAYSYGSGSIAVTTLATDTLISASSGIEAISLATAIALAAASTIQVTVAGSIDSGTAATGTGNPPAGVLAGYLGGTTDPTSYPVAGLYGSVTVDSSADITASAGDGIRAFNFGTGNVTVDDTGGLIKVLASPSPVDGFGNGIAALNFGNGSIDVTSHDIDSSKAGSGVFAVDEASSVSSAQHISVTAYGSIDSGSVAPQAGSVAAGILAGYNSDNLAENGVAGNVTIDDFASITAATGTDGIRGFNYGTGTVSITVETGADVAGGRYGVAAIGKDGGDVSIVNQGTVSGNTDAFDAQTTGAGTATIENYGTATGNVVMGSADSTFTNETGGQWSFGGASNFNYGSLTNDGAIYSAGSSAQIENVASFVNAGTIEVKSGTLAIDSVISGTGSMTIDAAATLNLSGSTVGANQTISFAAGTGTLILDYYASEHFSGIVSGFSGVNQSSSDYIDLTGVNFSSLTFTHHFDTTTDTLTVSDGVDTATIKFSSDVSASLAFASDGNLIGGIPGTSGTLIYDPPVGTEISSSSTSTPVVTAVNDAFVFGSTSGHETVADFQKGVDKIELDYFDPVSATGQAETFDQWAASGGIVHQGADTLVVLDPNHPQQSATLLLKNVASLSANDFIIHPGAHTA